jgi:MFS transporter, DHA1 family, tetracycline resistance protein
MRTRQAGLVFIIVTLIIDILGLGLVVPISPRLVKEFMNGDTSEAARVAGLLASVYATMTFFFSPILGSLSDKFGRRPVLLISLLGTGLDYVLLALAPTISLFFVGRLIAGLCGASIGTATAYIADVSPPEKRAQNFGFVGMAFGIGFVVGPLLGGLLGAINLRLPFWVAAGLSLVNAAWGVFVLPESLAPENRRNFSWAKANPFGTLKSLFKHRVVLGLSLYLFLFYLAQRGLENLWVLYTAYRYEWNIRETSFSLAMVGVGAAIVQGGLVRKVIPAIGEKSTILIGVTLSIVAFLGYAWAPEGWMIYCVLPLASVGAMAGPAAQGLMSKSVPPNEQGLLMGGLTSMQSMTQILGPLMATNLFSYFISAAAPIKIPGVSFYFGALLILLGLGVATMTLKNAAPVKAAPQ